MSDLFYIRPLTKNDAEWVTTVLANLGKKNGEIHALSGLIAEESLRRVGLLTYKKEGSVYQIFSLNALTPGKGIGTALLSGLEAEAKMQGCKKITVDLHIEENQLTAFYQKKGFLPKGRILEKEI